MYGYSWCVCSCSNGITGQFEKCSCYRGRALTTPYLYGKALALAAEQRMLRYTERKRWNKHCQDPNQIYLSFAPETKDTVDELVRQWKKGYNLVWGL